MKIRRLKAWALRQAHAQPIAPARPPSHH